MRFSKLIVVKRDYEHHSQKNKQAVWECICDCGKTTYVTGYELRTGITKSCGCLKGKPAEDLTGKRFGKLVVIDRYYQYGETKWNCKCDCGNITQVKASSLRSGAIQSCGCKERVYEDLTGQKFGLLTVICKDEEETKKHGGIYWKCLCECGNKKTVYSGHLKSGNIISCGCSSKSNGEVVIEKFLNENRYKYIPQKSFSDLISINGGKLFFDFYLPEYNLCIEYDGKQHYESVEYFGGEESFQLQIKNDLLKNEYCKNNNIHLLRIPYTVKFEDIPKIIIKYIQESCNDHSSESNDRTYAGNSPTLAS